MARWGTDSAMDVLAGVVRANPDTPGVNFARKVAAHHSQRLEKDAARGAVVGRLTRRIYPKSLSILTMPGVEWRFEKALLRNRESAASKREGNPRRTYITSIEREPAIYAASLRNIPGAELGLRHLPEDFATSVTTLRTPLISRYHCLAFEDFVPVNRRNFAAAWLDFTGPLTDRLIAAINGFAPFVRQLLVITVLDARQSRSVSNRILSSGGTEALLSSLCPDFAVADAHQYSDGVPMLQVRLERKPS